MAIEFNIEQDLAAVEAAIVDWKRREKDYDDKGIPCPQHIERRLELLKKDASLLRQQIYGGDR